MLKEIHDGLDLTQYCLNNRLHELEEKIKAGEDAREAYHEYVKEIRRSMVFLSVAVSDEIDRDNPAEIIEFWKDRRDGIIEFRQDHSDDKTSEKAIDDFALIDYYNFEIGVLQENLKNQAASH